MELETRDFRSLPHLLMTVYRQYREHAPVFQEERPVVEHGLYCPKCADFRRVRIRPFGPSHQPVFVDAKKIPAQEAVQWEGKNAHQLLNEPMHFGDSHSKSTTLRFPHLPAVFKLNCVQCETLFTAIVYDGPNGHALSVFPSVLGGIGTVNTPPSVRHYLDQAARAEAVGANSAAASMYRGAIENLLWCEGYKNGMCAQKIKDLEDAISGGNAPKWASRIEPEFLRLLKVIGDGSIHPNDGNISKQAAIDLSLLAIVHQVFSHLLYEVYEVTHMTVKRQAALKAAADILKR